MSGKRFVPPPTLESLEDRTVPSAVVGTYSDGVWRYDTSAGWAHISVKQASQLDIDDYGNVFGQFSDGLWRWDASAQGWQKLSAGSAAAFQTTAGGVLYAEFGSGGVWRWSPAAGWALLSGLDASAITVSDSDAFFGSFGNGTWRWTPAQGWALLTNLVPSKLLSDGLGAMVGVYGSQVWRYSPATGWANLNTPSANLLDVAADGKIFVFSTLGLTTVVGTVYRYDPAAPGSGWQAVTGYTAPGSALPAVRDGVAGAGGSFYFVFTYQTNGIDGATYTPGNSTTDYDLYTTSSQVQQVVAGKDGDFFIWFAGLPLYHWGPTTPLHQISTKVPSVLASQR